MVSSFRFDAADAFGIGVEAFDGSLVDFLKDMPREKVPDRLKGILASSGRSTGADAQI
jgi:hypothetical protein